jgi:hypothetical protein
VSYEPFVLPQTNQTLHSSAVYKSEIDASAWGATIQSLVVPAPHLGRFNPQSIWLHGEEVGYRSTSGYPLISMGWTFTSASQYVDIVAASTRPPDEAFRFVDLTVIGSVATPAHAVPAAQNIVCRVGTKASSTSTSAAFTQPPITGTVLVSLSPSAAWPIVGGIVYVGVIGSDYDVYEVTALTGASPYASITLRLLEVNAVAPGGTVPSGRTVGAAARHSVYIHGYHRRARW